MRVHHPSRGGGPPSPPFRLRPQDGTIPSRRCFPRLYLPEGKERGQLGRAVSGWLVPESLVPRQALQGRFGRMRVHQPSRGGDRPFPLQAPPTIG